LTPKVYHIKKVCQIKKDRPGVAPLGVYCRDGLRPVVVSISEDTDGIPFQGGQAGQAAKQKILHNQLGPGQSDIWHGIGELGRKTSVPPLIHRILRHPQRQPQIFPNLLDGTDVSERIAIMAEPRAVVPGIGAEVVDCLSRLVHRLDPFEVTLLYPASRGSQGIFPVIFRTNRTINPIRLAHRRNFTRSFRARIGSPWFPPGK